MTGEMSLLILPRFCWQGSHGGYQLSPVTRCRIAPAQRRRSSDRPACQNARECAFIDESCRFMPNSLSRSSWWTAESSTKLGTSTRPSVQLIMPMRRTVKTVLDASCEPRSDLPKCVVTARTTVLHGVANSHVHALRQPDAKTTHQRDGNARWPARQVWRVLLLRTIDKDHSRVVQRRGTAGRGRRPPHWECP